MNKLHIFRKKIKLQFLLAEEIDSTLGKEGLGVAWEGPSESTLYVFYFFSIFWITLSGA